MILPYRDATGGKRRSDTFTFGLASYLHGAESRPNLISGFGKSLATDADCFLVPSVVFRNVTVHSEE